MAFCAVVIYLFPILMPSHWYICLLAIPATSIKVGNPFHPLRHSHILIMNSHNNHLWKYFSTSQKTRHDIAIYTLNINNFCNNYPSLIPQMLEKWKEYCNNNNNEEEKE